MALTFGDNILYQGKKPLDARLLFDNLADMKAYSDNYLPPLAFCQNQEDGNFYVYNAKNDVDITTGKWRVINGGDEYNLPTSTTTTLGGVMIDGVSTVTDTNGVISVGISDNSDNTLKTVADGLYVPTATDSVLGSVKVDNKTISTDNGKIAVMLSSSDTDNSIVSNADGLSVTKSSKSKFGVVKLDGVTLNTNVDTEATEVQLSEKVETRRIEEIGLGDTYEYSNNLRIDAPYVVSFTPRGLKDDETSVSPSVEIYHENQRTGKKVLIKTLTSGTYSSSLPKEYKIIIKNNADVLTSKLDILESPDENILTVEKDGLMVDRYTNLANTYTPGFVLPDNDTVTIDGNGVISSTIGANSVSYRERNLIQLIRTYESLDVLPTVGDTNLIYKIPVDDTDPDTLYKEYIWDGSQYVDTGVLGKGNEDGIYIDEDETVPIATYVDEGKVRLDGDTIIRTNPDDVNDGTIAVNTEVIATQNDIWDVNSTIDTVDMNTPTLVPYEEDELFEIAWSLVSFDEKPEYTKEELDAILDQITFPGGGGSGGGGASGGEMSDADITRLWNEALGIGGTS